MELYQQLERELAEWSGMPEVVVCSSGTAALHLALEALQLPQGSKCIVPDFTMIACSRAVTLAGLEPVFVDCDNRLLMDLGQEVRAIVADTRNTKAVMYVHIYGRQYPMENLSPNDSRYRIEDLAEAHGCKPHSDTNAACWSFYKNKIIAGEEGGAVGFRDPKLAARARQLRSLGFTEEHDFTHVPRGCNYRMSNDAASRIRHSLWQYWHGAMPFSKRPPKNTLELRREAEAWYDEQCPDKWRMPSRDAPWIYDIRIPGMMPLRQTELVRALQAEGIAARHGFKPCHTQEEYRHCSVYGNGNAAVASREVIYLPLDPSKVTRESARKAFEVIRRVVG